MSTFNKEYDGLADAIITNAIVMPAVELKEGEKFPPYYYTDNVAWDTGAQFSFISPRVVEALELQPYREGKYRQYLPVRTSRTGSSRHRAWTHSCLLLVKATWR